MTRSHCDAKQIYQIIYIGNASFMGFIACEHLTFSGCKVLHLYVARQKKRCLAKDYFLKGRIPDWTKELSSFDEIFDEIKKLRQESKITDQTKFICTGEIESYHLHLWKIKHSWLVEGGDISQNLFKNTEESIKIRKKITNSAFIENIYGTQHDIIHSARLLGLRKNISMNVITHMPPLRLLQNAQPFLLTLQSKINQLKSTNELHQRKTLIFSPARKVYNDNTIDFTKGTDHIVLAFKSLSKLDLNLKYHSVLTGLEYERFYHDTKHIFDERVQCKYTYHMSQPSFHKILKNIDVIVLDQFGECERAFAGIFRESLFFGVPVISSFDIRDLVPNESTLLKRARNSDEIVEQISKIHGLPIIEYLEIRISIIKAVLCIYSSEKFRNFMLY